jgi:malate/lactate dehydrogenase
MSLVAIIGAGEIGGAVARALAARARVDTIRLIDDDASMAAGKSLDLLQSGAISRSDTRIEGARELAAASGAAAVVIADPSGTGAEWTGEPGLTLLRRLGTSGTMDGSVVICAGAGQGALMQRGFDELRLPRRRLIGSAPESLAATARALVAIEARAASYQVALTIVGRPPDKFAILWSEGSIAGHSIPALLSPPQLHRIEQRLLGLWPPGPGALGTAAAVVCEAVAAGSRRVFSAFVSLDRDNGTTAPVCAWPVGLGPAGLERVGSPVLTGRDKIVVDEVLQ